MNYRDFKLPPYDNMKVLAHALTLISNGCSHALEFGVFEGKSTNLIRNKLDSSYKIYGFDSFEGLPEDWEDTVCKKGFFNTNGAIPNIKDVEWFAGWFKDTLPEYLKEADNIAFIHMDCDLYSSTTDVFNALNKYIIKNTIICFDDWVYKANTPDIYDYRSDGEQKAFYEWTKTYDREYELVDFDTDGYLVEGQIVIITK